VERIQQKKDWIKRGGSEAAVALLPTRQTASLSSFSNTKTCTLQHDRTRSCCPFITD